MRTCFFPLLFLLCLATPSLAADLRCQGDLMTPGTIISKVRAKCGVPLSEDRVGEIKVRSQDRSEERMLYITEMTYKIGNGYYVLTFEGGMLKNTEYYQQ